MTVAPTSRDLAALLAARDRFEFRCPGDSYPINRSVHLARLAAGYEACRICPHRVDQSGAETVGPVDETADVSAAPSPERWYLAGQGIRGRYLNDVTRGGLGGWAYRIGCRWRTSVPASESGESRRVIAGHDARPSSPDLFAGVVAGLRRAGCPVLDVGLVPQPVAWDAMVAQQAHAVVYVTGAGYELSWNGLDVTECGPRPWSAGDWQELTGGDPPEAGTGDRLGELIPLRQATNDALDRLAAGLHGVRPLRFILAIPHAPQRRLAEQLFAAGALRVDWIECGLRRLDEQVDTDPDFVRVRETTVSASADFGLAVHDDGFGVTLFDETGSPVSIDQLATLLGAARFADPARRSQLLLPRLVDDFGLSGATSGRGDATCDGLATVVQLIARLSESDQPLSARLAGI